MVPRTQLRFGAANLTAARNIGFAIPFTRDDANTLEERARSRLIGRDGARIERDRDLCSHRNGSHGRAAKIQHPLVVPLSDVRSVRSDFGIRRKQTEPYIVYECQAELFAVTHSYAIESGGTQFDASQVNVFARLYPVIWFAPHRSRRRFWKQDLTAARSSAYSHQRAERGDYQPFFPESELTEASDRFFPYVSDLQLIGPMLKVVTFHGQGHSQFMLNPDFSVASFVFAESYWAAHRQLELKGRLNHRAEDCPERLKPVVVREWTPVSGSRDQMVSPRPGNVVSAAGSRG